MTKKVDDLENRSPRKNNIVYGIGEETGETADSLRNKVRDSIFCDILGVQTDSVERIHRLCRNLGAKPSPVTLNLRDYNQKSSGLKNAYNICLFRRNLWESARSNREQCDKGVLVCKKRKINDITYA